MPTLRTFPGIAFRAETPTAVSLPRMDIAAFVGFAPRGPIHVPVAVESYPDFVNGFGGLYPLAWDAEQGLWQTACLAPAVKAFFAQGGRRCWVVRVASEAQSEVNQFPLAGLLQAGGGPYGAVYAEASSAGSWSDRLQVRAELLLNPIAFEAEPLQPGTTFSLTLSPMRNQALQAGDVLQLEFTDRRYRAYGVLRQTALSAGPGAIALHPQDVHWFRVVQQPTVGLVERTRGDSMPILAWVSPLNSLNTEWVLTQNFSPFIALWFFLYSRGLPLPVLIVLLAIAFQRPQPGDWLSLTQGPDLRLWLVVSRVEAQRIILQDAWIEGSGPAVELSVANVQRVQIALQAREPAEADYRLENLACAAPHPRFMGHLPNDHQLFEAQLQDNLSQFPASVKALGAEVTLPRFPLALELPDTAVVLPLGLRPGLPSQGALPTEALPLVRDGLVPVTSDVQALDDLAWSAFWPTIFLDPVLRRTGPRSLLPEASDRLYLQNQPLLGIHALLPLEEISIIALPDAAHAGWRLTTPEVVVPQESSPAPEPPDPCAEAGPFIPCPPIRQDSGGAGDEGNSPGPSATPATQWQLLPRSAYADGGLLEVQRATAHFAAARGDWVALLDLPKQYRLPQVQTYQRQLLAALRRDDDDTDSYIAIYHPWLISREDTGELIHTSPTGAMAGVMADRAWRRGAWVAPANEVVPNVLATVPAFSTTVEQALYAAGINPLRQLPQGFVAWGSFTQSRSADLEDLNVRRLLILLRRLALREGQTYVFAAHDAALRRRIQQQFEQMLARLFDLGAFAGTVPDEAYQVVIDNTLNTQANVEQGRLAVELRVAPAQPMTFITVRLVQSETDPLTVQEVRTHGG